ncbi:MAG: hypothetical protein U1A25_02195 [Candidatus Sungbacteria bacterium]|nr:hypothetical protein [bacterium]MDZ4260452.1 hypothetical protein [Candidatus Sungbacteria bacterium]
MLFRHENHSHQTLSDFIGKCLLTLVSVAAGLSGVWGYLVFKSLLDPETFWQRFFFLIIFGAPAALTQIILFVFLIAVIICIWDSDE